MAAALAARWGDDWRAVMPAKARPLLAAVVFWDRIVDTRAARTERRRPPAAPPPPPSAAPSPAGGGASTSRRAGDGRPYMRMRPAVTRSAAAGVGR